MFCIKNKKGREKMLKTSEVINYIEKMYDIKLMDYQKEFVKHIVQ